MQHKKTKKKKNTRKLKVIAKLAKMECELFKSNEQYPSLVMRCRSGALNIFYKTETATETEPKKPRKNPKENPENQRKTKHQTVAMPRKTYKPKNKTDV